MPGDDWLHCRCYKRRTILGLALAPLLAGPARAAEEGEAAKPPAPEDRFVTWGPCAQHAARRALREIPVRAPDPVELAAPQAPWRSSLPEWVLVGWPSRIVTEPLTRM